MRTFLLHKGYHLYKDSIVFDSIVISRKVSPRVVAGWQQAFDDVEPILNGPVCSLLCSDTLCVNIE